MNMADIGLLVLVYIYVIAIFIFSEKFLKDLPSFPAVLSILWWETVFS